MMKSFLPTAKKILTNPNQFFIQDFKKIRHWKEPLTYLVIFTLLTTFFLTYHRAENLKAIASMNIFGLAGLPHFEVGLTGYVLIYFASAITLILLTSLKYWISHWFITNYNAKAKFQQTYAVMTYGGTPGWIAIPFFVIGSALLFMAITKGGFLLWLVAILSILIWASLEGYSIYLRIYALAKIQNITFWQAVLSVYVFGLLAYLAIVFIIEALLIFIVLLAMAALGTLSI